MGVIGLGREYRKRVEEGIVGVGQETGIHGKGRLARQELGWVEWGWSGGIIVRVVVVRAGGLVRT